MSDGVSCWLMADTKLTGTKHCLWRLRTLKLLLLVSSIIEASGLSHVASCHKVYIWKSKFHSVWLKKKRNSCTSVLPNTCAWEQQDINTIIKDRGEEGKKKGMNVERSTVGTKKSSQPKRQKSLNLVQSRQSLTTVRQEVSDPTLKLHWTVGKSQSLRLRSWINKKLSYTKVLTRERNQVDWSLFQ